MVVADAHFEEFKEQFGFPFDDLEVPQILPQFPHGFQVYW